MFVRIFFAFLALAWMGTGLAYSSDELAKAGRSTHVTVESSELEPFDLNKKTNADDKIKVYQDKDTVIGINDDGAPSVGMKF